MRDLRTLHLPVKAWLLCMLVLAFALSACEGDEGGLEVSEAWVRAVNAAPAAGADAGPTTGAFLTISNSARKTDRLIGAACPNARSVEIHETSMDGDVMQMRPLKRIDLPAGETVALEPGGMHLMLVGVYETLEPGDTIPLTLVFEQAGSLTVQAEVRAE